MGAGTILRIIMIATGILLLCFTVSSLAKRRMTEPFCLTWGVVSMMLILAGILLRPVEWNRYISGTGMLLVLLIGFCVIYGAFFMSAKISELMRRNLELAMQVSLLNQESRVLQERLAGLEQRLKADEDFEEERAGNETAFNGNQYAGKSRSRDCISGACKEA